MSTVENLPRSATLITQPLPEVWDPDDVYEGARSPMLQPVVPRLSPSPSPEPMVPVAETPEKGPHKEHRTSMADGVLVHFMANGKHQDVSRQVAREPLASPEDADQMEGKEKGIILGGKDREEVEQRKGSTSEGESELRRENEVDEGEMPLAHAEKDEDLAALAAKALKRTGQTPSHENGQINGSTPQATVAEPMEDVKVTIPSIVVNNTPSRLIPDLSIISEMQISTDGTGALPPIQHLTKTSLPDGSSSVTLPSITDQLGDIKNLPDTPRDQNFPQSPPPPPPPRFPGHGSPPRSPNDFRALPSPGRNFFYAPHRRQSQVEAGTPYSDGLPYPSPVDYTSSNAETPSDQSTPAMGIDRMSIDGITNPQIGGYQCTYAGCTAQPFQTQYLLNSHANVHSQNRPHYCAVKGCPRSEGGKGFKRKNEMIRHGLVHDSPGYVCPFCPDREHKYPRPDNLQRHVRVHHVDKDKDDPLLRDVLAQRPEGPSRGRRRRGTTG